MNAAAKADSQPLLMSACYQYAAQTAQVRIRQDGDRLDEKCVDWHATGRLGKIGDGEEITNQFRSTFSKKHKFRVDMRKNLRVLRAKCALGNLRVKEVLSKCDATDIVDTTELLFKILAFRGTNLDTAFRESGRVAGDSLVFERKVRVQCGEILGERFESSALKLERPLQRICRF